MRKSSSLPGGKFIKLWPMACFFLLPDLLLIVCGKFINCFYLQTTPFCIKSKGITILAFDFNKRSCVIKTPKTFKLDLNTSPLYSNDLCHPQTELRSLPTISSTTQAPQHELPVSVLIFQRWQSSRHQFRIFGVNGIRTTKLNRSQWAHKLWELEEF